MQGCSIPIDGRGISFILQPGPLICFDAQNDKFGLVGVPVPGTAYEMENKFTPLPVNFTVNFPMDKRYIGPYTWQSPNNLLDWKPSS